MAGLFLITLSAVFFPLKGWTTNQKTVILPVPFEITVEPMDRLLLVNFEKDPDTLYIGFEPQIFNDTVMGTGQLIIGWRKDGRVDVYHDPGLNPEPDAYDIAGKGLANMVVHPFEEDCFRVNERGVQANCVFRDIHGRQVELLIRENNTRERKPFALLAPMGQAAESPSAMPMIWLNQFYFVRRKNTDIRVSIDGRVHRTDRLPMRIDRSRMTFIRYDTDPFITTLNPAHDGPVPVLEMETDRIAKEIHRITEDGTEYLIEMENHANRPNHEERTNHADRPNTTDRLKPADQPIPVLSTMIKWHENHFLSLMFEPSFPNVLYLDDGEVRKGSFKIAGNPAAGRITGDYRVHRSGENVRINMTPSGGWSPEADRFSLRFLYRMAKIFRNWPTTYVWEAEISLPESREDEQPVTPVLEMNSSWKRTDR